MASNATKMLQAILAQIGDKVSDYGPKEMPTTIYQAEQSENYLISAVARIIRRIEDDNATSNEVYKEINQFLNNQV